MKALTDLYNKGIIMVLEDGTIALTDEAKRLVDKRAIQFVSSICEDCNGKRIKFSGSFNELFKLYRQAVRNRPEPILKYFQGYLKEYDVIARVALMHYHGDLIGKSFVFIGDDDLVSVAVALTHLPSRICVLDVDKRIGEFISSVNREYGLDIEFREYNVSEPLPKDLLFSFDVASSEPLESLNGLRAFVNRGVGCLKDGGCGYFGLTTLEASYHKWHRMERMLLANNCIITDIIRDFSIYPMRYASINYEQFATKLPFATGENKGIDWYKSCLIRFEVIGKRNPRKFNKRLPVELLDLNEDLTYPDISSLTSYAIK